MIFSRVESDLFHDGVRFDNGTEISLQRLGQGVKARVEDALLLTPHLHRRLEMV